MSLHLAKTPPAVTALAHEELGRRLAAKEFIAALRGSPKIGTGIPMFTVTKKSLQAESLLARSKRTGWCFPIMDGEVPGTAVIRTEHKGLRYHGILGSDFAKRLMTVVRKAEAKHSKGKPFELRLLEIPHLRYFAAWLHADNGRGKFLALASPGKRQADEPITETALKKVLQKRAAAPSWVGKPLKQISPK
jgi:hypothetical protein